MHDPAKSLNATSSLNNSRTRKSLTRFRKNFNIQAYKLERGRNLQPLEYKD